MRKWNKPALFGLLWLTFAVCAFAGGSNAQPHSVPETTTLALMGAGLILLGMLRKRKSDD